MNYQPLFELMSEHGLTLLESQMDEIVIVVNEMQQAKPKKLTYTELRTLYLRHSNLDSLYNALLPYLADEQPATVELTSSETKPEPSRLEVAMMLLAGHKANSSSIVTDHTVIGVFELADELIKQAKG